MPSQTVANGHNRLVGIFRTTSVCLLLQKGPHLTSRQLGILLTCYHTEEAQTVRGLASKLNVSKPAITRALDRLASLELIRRKTDPKDRRSVLVGRTLDGVAYMRALKTTLKLAAKSTNLSATQAATQDEPTSSLGK
jgi:DNA-binding MarR family transcriptional regulator